MKKFIRIIGIIIAAILATFVENIYYWCLHVVGSTSPRQFWEIICQEPNEESPWDDFLHYQCCYPQGTLTEYLK